MKLILELTEADFDRNVLQSAVPVLVDFWSPSCVPCRMLVPILEELANDNIDEVRITKINVAQFPQIVTKYGIEILPTILIFNKGIVVEQIIGVQSKDKLQNILDAIE
ncbi:MAG: thioredoxin [Planctomycetaceae bacterium]|jgi:thioredoxin 1|nr:thioredoxin [Planctomycetaceae bacterium]